jgi:hypothetical protein
VDELDLTVTEVDHRDRRERPVRWGDHDGVHLPGPLRRLLGELGAHRVAVFGQHRWHRLVPVDRRLVEPRVAEAVVEVPVRVDDPADRSRGQLAKIGEQLVGLTEAGSGVDNQEPVSAHDDPDRDVVRRVAAGEAAGPDLRPARRVGPRRVAGTASCCHLRPLEVRTPSIASAHNLGLAP